MKYKRKTFKVEVPSMAMGDIGFLLLIFFVILARTPEDDQLWVPAREVEVITVGRAPASILIDTENRMYVNGDEIDQGQLASRINSILGDLPPGKRKVFLKVHREVTAKLFEPVIAAVSEAGGDLIHILEKEKESGD
jgi:biopolymer transport protein ExbD